jgi:photosystem II stability/assembly factor-like uncharacterized protein
VLSQDWELTSLTQPVRKVVVVPGGSVLASTDQQLLRTDDSGLTWSPVTLPPATALAGVDPADAGILYAAGGAGVYRTDDPGATWRVILHYSPQVGTDFGRLAISAADDNRLYVALTGPASLIRLMRSDDAGVTWQPLQASQSSRCAWTIPLLQADSTQPDQVFQSAACLAGRTFGASLKQSTDAGASWLALFNPEPYQTPALGYPSHLAIGPGRYYLASNRDARLGGSGVFRSDDDGTTWNEVLAHHGGGTPGYRQADQDPDAPNVRIGGLVVDSANADLVYVGLQVYRGYPPVQMVGGGVLISADGGASWKTLGQDLGGISDLVLSAENQRLYAATDQGLWSLAVPSTGAAARQSPR